MHSHTLVLAVLLFTRIQALPLTSTPTTTTSTSTTTTSPPTTTTCDDVCISSNISAESTTTITVTHKTPIPLGPRDNWVWIPTPTTRFSFLFPTTPVGFKTKPYSNTGDPVSAFLLDPPTETPYINTGDPTRPFLKVRETGAATAGEQDKVGSTFAGTKIGNGVTANEDLDGDIAIEEARDSGTESTPLLARKGAFGGGGGGVPPRPALKELGTVSGGNDVPLPVAEDTDFTDARDIVTPRVFARYILGVGNGILVLETPKAQP